MRKSLITILRKSGLIKLADKFRYYINYIKSYGARKKFKKENPNVVLPPSYYIYETFNLDYFAFYNESIETAKWLISHFKKHKVLENAKILDWGCGPGRTIRHLPKFASDTNQFYGTDYNKDYITWCKKNISKVHFETNNLKPPMAFGNNMFDVVYGISIFTHLTKELHFLWFDELIRVLKPGGILFITLHGEAFLNKLTNIEIIKFNKGELVERSSTKIGHRTFASFQPKSFVKLLIGKNKVLEFIPGDLQSPKPQQDIWIIKKSN